MGKKQQINNFDLEPETLRSQLDVEWRDHIQSRDQLWKSLQVEAILFVGLVGVDLKFDNLWLVSVFGSFVILMSLLGFALAATHWRVQERKIQSIDNLEEALGLKNVIAGHSSGGVQWIKIVDPRSTLAVVIILRMNLLIILFTSVYVGARLIIR